MNRKAESSIEPLERYIRIYSRAASRVLAGIPGIQPLLSTTSILCFLGMSYADIPMPKQYDLLFDYSNPSEHVRTPIEVRFAVLAIDTRIVVHELPYGTFTLALLNFREGIPRLLHKIPEAEFRHRGATLLAVSSYETWNALHHGV